MTAISNIYGKKKREEGGKKEGRREKSESFPRRYRENRQVLVRIAN